MEKEINLPVYEKDKCFLFALGRNAMYAACKAMNIASGDEILTPAFDCDGSLQPFKVLNCSLKFYKSDPYSFTADLNDIRKKISSKTRLLHIINHFGFPQPWDDLLGLRKETGIPILEDNAYSLFSEFKGKPLGFFGDFAIFSLRKNLSIIDGGMLRINNPDFSFTMPDKKAKWFYPTERIEVFDIVKRKMGYKIPYWIKKIVARPDNSCPPPLYSEEHKGYPEWWLRDVIEERFSCDYLRLMSKIAKSQLSKIKSEDYAAITKNKREYYSFLSEKLKGIKGISILWSVLPEGVVPFCLLILVSRKRDEFFEQLRKNYDVMAWPTLSGEVLGQLPDFPEVELLGRKLLQINLPSDKVRLPSFRAYLERITQDMYKLAGEYLEN